MMIQDGSQLRDRRAMKESKRDSKFTHSLVDSTDSLISAVDQQNQGTQVTPQPSNNDITEETDSIAETATPMTNNLIHTAEKSTLVHPDESDRDEIEPFSYRKNQPAMKLGPI